MLQKLGARFRQRLIDTSLAAVQALDIRNAWKKRSSASDSQQTSPQPPDLSDDSLLPKGDKQTSRQADNKETASSHDKNENVSPTIRSITHHDADSPHFFSTSETDWTPEHPPPAIGNREAVVDNINQCIIAFVFIRSGVRS
ncbi:hypothetical protein DL769_011006 [Monosporascus sp. CRB-8-3]|nr:hypothetical protein DL769_011006 [Monosporascus sp. CRB-8-3]